MAAPIPSDTPQQLLAAMQTGCEQSLKVLWQDWASKVQFYARMQLSRCGMDAEHLAQEVVADVFLDVWRHPGRFDGRVAFSTWLFTLTRNKSIDCLRKHLRQIRHEQSVDDDTLANLPDNGLTPEAQLHAIQDRRAVEECLERLRNPLQREALVLWAMEGMPLIDIAQTQQCPENTVKTRLFHGRKNLRTCLQQSLALKVPTP